MLDLTCPEHAHTHFFLDEDSAVEYIIPESFVQRVKDELIELYRRNKELEALLEALNDLEDPTD